MTLRLPVTARSGLLLTALLAAAVSAAPLAGTPVRAQTTAALAPAAGADFRRAAETVLGLARGVPAAHAAADAGFADQSHFSRACRDLHGLPPGRLVAQSA